MNSNVLINKLNTAMKYAASIRPKVGGFPYLAESLRQAGFKKNLWYLPSCQSIYIMEEGNLVQQGTPLIMGLKEITRFDRDRLIKAIRSDQAGESTFPEFLEATWGAGVVSYEVDFINRKVIYYGALGESYIEDYPSVKIDHP